MDPVTAQFALMAAGMLGSKLLGGRPKAPDLVSPAMAAAAGQQRSLDRSLARQGDRLEGDLAAAGATGSAGVASRQGLQSAGLDAMAQLAGRNAASIAGAQNQQRMVGYQGDLEAGQARQQGLSGMLQTLAFQHAMGTGQGGLSDKDPKVMGLSNPIAGADPILPQGGGADILTPDILALLTSLQNRPL